MSRQHTAKQLSVVLANTYALYLKTQNYHWHVQGPNFKSLHELFEEQYTDLAIAIDNIAERVVILGSKAPATFSQFNELKTISDGNPDAPADQMLQELTADQDAVIESLQAALATAQECGDEGSVALIGERIAQHEKNRWMLDTSIS